MRANNLVEPNGSAADRSKDSLRVEKSADAMGTTFSVILYGADLAEMVAAVDTAFGELHRLDQMLSNYQPGSEWSHVNLNAAHRAFTISPELFRLLSACQKYSEESEGAFDITVGYLMRVWGFYKGAGRLPAPAEVTAALAQVGYRHVHLDPARQTVQFDHPGVELDPGGIGKGYAIDRMVDILKQKRFARALVVGSGSSIYGLGTPPAGSKGWRVSVADPRDPRKSAAEVFLKNMSISTSGGYRKLFFAEGRTYAHMIDPRTGYPAGGTSLVSVLAPQAIDSEAWTKPYFINGRAWTARHRPKEFSVFFCEEMSEAGAWLEPEKADAAQKGGPQALKRGYISGI